MARINKVLLIRPAMTLPRDIKNQGIAEPIGVLYIASSLREHGYKVSVLDLSAVDLIRARREYITYGEDHRGISSKIRAVDPDIIGVSCPFSASEFDLFETCKIAKSVFRDVPVVVGGQHPSFFPERMLTRPYVDYVILGEGEVRFRYLIEALNAGDRDLRFDGIAYRGAKGIVIHDQETWIRDLDVLPYPARDLVDMSFYPAFNKKYKLSLPRVTGMVLATRGCFNTCAYCVQYKYWGGRVRARSVRNIMGELHLLKDSYAVEDVFFLDDNLFWNKHYVLDLCSELKKIDVRPSAPLGMPPDALDVDVIRAMAEAGFTSIELSIGSASIRVLRDIMHRKVDLDRVPEIVKEGRKNNLKVYGSFVLGMIGESRQEIFETLDYPKRVGLDGVRFYAAFPFPGSDLFDVAKKKRYLSSRRSHRRSFIGDFSVLRIPRSAADFVMDPDELRKLLVDKQSEFDV